MSTTILYQTSIDTPAGDMIAIASDEALYLLEFIGRRDLDKELIKVRACTAEPIREQENNILQSIKQELSDYFTGKLSSFKTPLHFIGTPFQQRVWQQLQKIPSGKTQSYRDLASAVDNPKGYRAVARANGANQLAIVVPCHRVINADGGLGGYGGGLERKQWLLDHECSAAL